MRRSTTYLCGLGMFLAVAGTAAAAPATPPILRTAPAPSSRLAPRANTCVTQAVTCGQSISGTLATTDCPETSGSDTFYDDKYVLAATAGQQIAVSMSSTAVFPLVFLIDPSGHNVAQDNGNGSSAQISFTIPANGNYTIIASSDAPLETGAYGLTVACGTQAATTCTPGPTTLCLNGNRFQVSATFQTATQSGAAQVVKLTDDTGYLWFFNPANVETVLKVLNACVPSLGNHYWFFAGGLTNVFTQIRVTDTTTGFTRVYTNPLNEPFQPIQDTSAFPDCP
jgi:hypothetical protein